MARFWSDSKLMACIVFTLIWTIAAITVPLTCHADETGLVYKFEAGRGLFNEDVRGRLGIRDHMTPFLSDTYEPALRFSGRGGYFSLDPGLLDGAEEATIMAWIRLESHARKGQSPIVVDRTKSDFDFQLVILPEEHEQPRRAAFAVVTESGKEAVAASSTEIPLYTWTHVCGVYEGHRVKLYLNGKKDGMSGFLTGPMASGSGDARVGGHRFGVPTFHGSIAGLRIYKRALNPRSIREIARLVQPDTRRVGKSEKPNIILVIIDALRADHVSCINKTALNGTPNLDRLAEKGVVFSKAVAQGPFTRPALGSIFTGEYPSRHRGYEGLLSTNSPAFGRISPRRDQHISKEMPDLFVSLDQLGYHTWVITQNYSPRAHALEPHGETGCSISPKAVVPEVIDFLETVIYPYFLYVHLIDPHRPYDTALLADKTLPKDPHCELSLEECSGLPIELAQKKYRLEVNHTDREFGRLLDYLEHSGFFESGLLVVAADHGEYFEQRPKFHSDLRPREKLLGTFCAFSLYQELLHVPLIVTWPGRLPKGREVKKYVETRKLFDLFLAAADKPGHGSELLDRAKGLPVAPQHCFAEGVNRDAMVFLNNGDGELKAIISPDGYKLIYSVKRRSFELYDLKRDPGEQNDLSERPEYRDKARTLLEKLGNTLDLEGPYLDPAEIRRKALEKQRTGRTEKPSAVGTDDEERKQYLKRLKDLGYL